ncbi:hypothetical protein [Chryseobacterium viscerum]|nr:hypothetical protein [Chryseobacterium viscerum]
MRFYLALILLFFVSLSSAQSIENSKKVREKQLKVQNQKENLDFKRVEE